MVKSIEWNLSIILLKNFILFCDRPSVTAIHWNYKVSIPVVFCQYECLFRRLVWYSSKAALLAIPLHTSIHVSPTRGCVACMVPIVLICTNVCF